MTITKARNIKIIAGYYEFHIFMDDELVYSIDGDCADDWSEHEDKTDCAELYVDAILYELKEDERWTEYGMIAANKEKVIKALAAFMADWTED